MPRTHADNELTAEAREMGQRAGRTGYSLKVCPYEPGTDLWIVWRDAWARAREAAQHPDPA